MNLCTDTLLFELLSSASIVSVTRLSREPDLSPFYARAATMNVNRGEVEEVLAMSPDLVVTVSGGSGLAERLFERYGTAVLRLPHANDFAGYRRNLRQLANILNVSARAERLIATLDQALAVAPGNQSGHRARSALLYQPNGYTPARDSLMGEILRLAGFRNLAYARGYRHGGFVSLENVLLMQPEIVVFSTRDTTRPSLAEELLKHPALRHWTATERPRSLRVPERLWTCPGAFNADALTALQSVH